MNQHDRARASLQDRIRNTEADLFASFGIEVEERFLELERTGVRMRVLSHGSGPPLVLLHGVSLSAAAWVPLFAELQGFRLLAVDLPGHGFSDPVPYRRGRVREHTHRLTRRHPRRARTRPGSSHRSLASSSGKSKGNVRGR